MKTIIALVAAIAVILGVSLVFANPALAGVRPSFLQGTGGSPGSGNNVQGVSGSGGASENITAVVVKASRVEAHIAGAADDKWVTLFTDPPAVDLVKVAGQEYLIGTAQLPAGKYTQVRVSVTGVTVTANGQEYQAEVPGHQLKLVGNFSIVEGRQTAITLDFEAPESVVFTADGKVTLKPVIKLESNSPDKGKPESSNQLKSEKQNGKGKGPSDNVTRGSGSRDNDEDENDDDEDSGPARIRAPGAGPSTAHNLNGRGRGRD